MSDQPRRGGLFTGTFGAVEVYASPDGQSVEAVVIYADREVKVIKFPRAALANNAAEGTLVLPQVGPTGTLPITDPKRS